MFRTLKLVVTLHGGGLGRDASDGRVGRKLGVPRDHLVAMDALVTTAGVVGGAAVIPIGAAHSLSRSERGSDTVSPFPLLYSMGGTVL